MNFWIDGRPTTYVVNSTTLLKLAPAAANMWPILVKICLVLSGGVPRAYKGPVGIQGYLACHIYQAAYCHRHPGRVRPDRPGRLVTCDYGSL